MVRRQRPLSRVYLPHYHPVPPGGCVANITQTDMTLCARLILLYYPRNVRFDRCVGHPSSLRPRPTRILCWSGGGGDVKGEGADFGWT